MNVHRPTPPAVLVTGEPSSSRTEVVRRLTASPACPLVFESYDLWEIIGLVPRCSVVVIDGDLDEAPASSLVRLLSHRHPGLRLLVRADTLSVRDGARLTERGGALFPGSLGHPELASLCEAMLGSLLHPHAHTA